MFITYLVQQYFEAYIYYIPLLNDLFFSNFYIYPYLTNIIKTNIPINQQFLQLLTDLRQPFYLWENFTKMQY
jgi:hypothetical protein